MWKSKFQHFDAIDATATHWLISTQRTTPHNDLLELRQRLGGLSNFFELRGAVAEAELRRRVVEDVARRVGAVRRVDARREPAGQDAS